MVRAESGKFAPNFSIQNGIDFLKKTHFAKDRLSERYSLAHQQDREIEIKQFNDGIGWAGPADFVSPIDSMRKYIPNEKSLNLIEDALSGIHDWPNARGQARQLNAFIRYGAIAELYEEVAQVVGLVAKIAKEKPFGDRTIGMKLLDEEWKDVSSDDYFGCGESETQKIFTSTIKRLSDLAEGKSI